MKKLVFLLSLTTLGLLGLVVFLLVGRGVVPTIPKVDMTKVSPVPSNTMLNELKEGTLGEETMGGKQIVADGVSFGGIKQGTIEASNFKFVPDAISVNQGDTVIVTIKNTQGIHDFVIDELEVKSKTLSEGQSEEITFVASKKGTFQFYSSVGQQRSMGMVGTIVVN